MIIFFWNFLILIKSKSLNCFLVSSNQLNAILQEIRECHYVLEHSSSRLLKLQNQISAAGRYFTISTQFLPPLSPALRQKNGLENARCCARYESSSSECCLLFNFFLLIMHRHIKRRKNFHCFLANAEQHEFLSFLWHGRNMEIQELSPGIKSHRVHLNFDQNWGDFEVSSAILKWISKHSLFFAHASLTSLSLTSTQVHST